MGVAGDDRPSRFHGRRAVLMLLAALVSGCGQRLPAGPTVSGRVTVDGVPLEQGSILFVPVGREGTASGGLIAGGRYEIGGRGVALGVNRVEIRALRKSGRRIQAPVAKEGQLIDEEEEAIAEQFNSSSSLSADVKPGSQNIDFAVTSRPPATK